jgi:glycosyltransferase involved in cell wall biosynthesis
LEQKQVSHLHWIPGVIDIDDLPFVTEVSSKVVWTLHDMWAFTGGCHYSLNCEKFKLSCSRCPQVRNIFSKIPRAQLSDKKKVFEKVLSKIVFVTPSHWLKQQAAASRTLMNADIRVVKNPIDLPRFLAVSNVAEVRAKLLIKSTDFVVGCAAMNLSDPLKNIEFIAQVVAKFADSQTLSPRRVVLLCIGSGSIQGVYSSENLRIIGTGQVSQDELVRIYSAMDVFVSAAKAENFPNTLIEALACGVPLICSNVGGMPEIVIESKSGYLFDQENENELFQALLALFNQKELKRAFSVAATEYIRKEFLNSRTQEKYLSIYQE